MLNALAAVQGGLQARENAFQGQASEQYRNALAQYGMEAPQTRQAFAAVDPRGANSLMMQERQMTQQGDQFQQTMGLREREFEATNADRQARLQITRQNAARQAMALTAQMSAQERAQEAAVLERALATATTAQTPEDWDRIMTGFGEQGAQFVGQFERRDEIFAGVMGLTDALKARQGPERDSAKEQQIARLMETGLSREISIGIADNRFQVNEGRVFDLATGDQVAVVPSRQPEASRPGPTVANADTLYGRAEDATGFVPAAGRTLSGTVGQLPIVGQVFQAPDMVAANQAYRQTGSDLIRALSLNPRFPVAEVDRIERDLGLKPGITVSAPDMRTRMRELDTYLRGRAEVERRAAADPSLARSDRDNAAQAVRDIERTLQLMGVPQEQGTGNWMLDTDPATWTEEQWSEAEQSGFLNDR